MNKLKPRNKICFQNNENVHSDLNLLKLKKKKWNLLKKNILKEKNFIKEKPEKKKIFYKERLFTKQQLKNFYGCVPEYQLKNIFQTLNKKKDKTNILEDFIILLESRLDIIIYRLKVTRSIFEAKQIINHGKVQINGKYVFSQNYILKKGDIISFHDFKTKKREIIKVPYIEYNRYLKKGVFLNIPSFNQIKYPFFLNLKLIDEYLKKK